MELRVITTPIDDLAAEVDRLEAKLDEQWQWFKDHPRQDKGNHKGDIFLRTLKQYEDAYDRWYAAANEGLPCP